MNALEFNALAMFGYMTDLEKVSVDPACDTLVTATGKKFVAFSGWFSLC